MSIPERLDGLIALIHEAENAVMEVYSTDFAVEMKQDDTPLTIADKRSHTIVTTGLAKLFPDIPIVSEEGDEQANSRMVLGETFWLVDPLDGTREFASRSGHFCVCVGLVVDGRPYFGLVADPVRNAVYYGGSDMGSFKIENNQPAKKIEVSKNNLGIVLGSRFDKGGPTYDYIAEHYSDSRLESVGSMLKIIRIAEGLADASPSIQRPLHLWDVAAGQAILEGAGGTVTRPDGSPIDYHAESLMAGDFVARSTESL